MPAGPAFVLPIFHGRVSTDHQRGKQMNRTLFFAAALALALPACKSLDVHEPRILANQHFIKVSVYSDARGTPQIEVDVPELHVRGPDHVIFWVIDDNSQSYSFPNNGILFDQAGQQQLDCERLNAKRFKCKDKNTAKGKFKYVVSLDGSPSVKPLDPFIINN